MPGLRDRAGRFSLVAVAAAPAQRHARSTGERLTTVLIVNYQTGPLLARCVMSVLHSTTPVEVLVVDNASRDDSVRLLREKVGSDPRLTIVENRRNYGFARACNQGLARVRGSHVLFLNPDAVLPPEAMARLRATLEAEPRAGMAGPLLVGPDGREQNGSRRDLPSLQNTFARAFNLPRRLLRPALRDLVRAGEPLPAQPVPVDAVSGACMLVSRAAIDEVGPLDEAYFLHCEDLDWCTRFRRAGLGVYFVPHVRVVHDLGVSCRQRGLLVLWHKHRGMVRYYWKFLRPDHSALLAALVATAIGLRFAGLALHAIAAAAWSRVFGRS